MPEIPRCTKCGMPKLQVMSCTCPQADHFMKTLESSEEFTQIDDDCGLMNAHFRHEAWSPNMHITVQAQISAEELRTCKNNIDVLEKLFFAASTD